MKKYWTIREKLPTSFSGTLFGDRQRYGNVVIPDDPDWIDWQNIYLNFYQNTQKRGLGNKVNDAGYKILNKVDMSEKDVVEIGPGILPHSNYWRGLPRHYTLVDNQQTLLDFSANVLTKKNIPHHSHLTDSHILPIKDTTVDVMIIFYALEHLNPLALYMNEISRVLRPNGILVGAIPTEGGLAWGLGRYFTSRKYLLRHSKINSNKIICWEHPNFAENILRTLNAKYENIQEIFWPFGVKIIDINLIISFIYKKRER